MLPLMRRQHQEVLYWGCRVIVFYTCSVCGNRIPRLSFSAFVNSWNSGYGHRYSLGFKCARCGSRYIFPWYSGFLSGIGVFLALIHSREDRCLINFSYYCHDYFILVNFSLIIIFIFISYCFGPLKIFYRNEKYVNDE